MRVLKSVGSKFMAAKDIMSLTPMGFREYREPFCASGAVLEFVPAEKKRWINDLNPDIIRVHKAVRGDREYNHPEDFLERILELRELPLKQLPSIFEQAKSDLVFNDCPLAYVILNRLSYNQYVRRRRSDISPLGLSALGRGNISFRQLSKEKLRNARRVLQDVRITCGSYEALLEEEGDNVWLFIDPPYPMRAGSELYECHFSDDQQKDLADRLKVCKHRFLLTISRCTLTTMLYGTKDFQSPFRKEPGFRIIPRYYRYHGGDRRNNQKPCKELIVMNYDH